MSRCNPYQVRNPATGRCVDKYGPIGRAISKSRSKGKRRYIIEESISPSMSALSSPSMSALSSPSPFVLKCPSGTEYNKSKRRCVKSSSYDYKTVLRKVSKTKKSEPKIVIIDSKTPARKPSPVYLVVEEKKKPTITYVLSDKKYKKTSPKKVERCPITICPPTPDKEWVRLPSASTTERSII